MNLHEINMKGRTVASVCVGLVQSVSSVCDLAPYKNGNNGILHTTDYSLSSP